MSIAMNSKKWIAASVGLALLTLASSALLLRARAGTAANQRIDVARFLTLQPSGTVSASRLAQAIEPLFNDKAIGHTQALIVMRDGKIIAERYAEGIDAHTKLLSRSIGKTITAALVGLMVSDGRLALDSPVPIDAWSQPGDPRGDITLRNLLQMESGLEHREDDAPLYRSDTVRMLFTDGAQDMATFAESKPIARPPGSHFNYSTADTVILSDLMARTLTSSERPSERRNAMMKFIRGRLMIPVGLSSLTPEFDAQGTMIGGAIMHMTARDYARFGEFLRNKGRVGGHQVLSARWVDFMETPSEHNPAYGGHLWLNRRGEASPLFPTYASKRIFAAVGRHGQYLVIDPTRGLVILRMGISSTKQYSEIRGDLVHLISLFPAT